MTLPTIDHRAIPVDIHENGDENERRYRAEIERAFSLADSAFRQAERRISDLEVKVAELDAIVNP